MSEFWESRDKHVAGLWFARDGCEVVVVPRDGQVARVFQLTRFWGPQGEVEGEVQFGG